MERIIKENEAEAILSFGALEYDSFLCAQVLGWEESEVLEMMENPESEFSKHYQKGRYRAEFAIDRKLFEQAQQGDIKSLDKLDERKALRKRLARAKK